MFYPPFLYIDPNAGLQILQQGGPFFGFLLAILGALLWPFRYLWKQFWNFFKKNRKPFFIIAAALFVTAGIAAAYCYGKASAVKTGSSARVIILGMDGLDPGIIEKMMTEGELPHFKALKDSGSYSRLQTVLPAQSPVAWSTFATGLNPGGHGLYDFLWRHTDSYMPDLALSELKSPKTLNILGMKVPLGKPRFENRRKGKTMWAYTSEAGVPTTVIHCPVTFPAEEVSGAMLSGMGVPDLLGTQGTFHFYSDNLSSAKAQGGKQVSVAVLDGRVETVFKGPRGVDGKEIEVPVEVKIDPDKNGAELRVAGETTHLKLREWSPWLRIRFSAKGISPVEGMSRFYLRSLLPEFRLYVSALNFTPENPVFPISYPNDYAKQLKDAIGDFHTLGMPHDTWALNEGAMDEEMFLEQSQAVLDEETAMLKHELPRFKDGLFVFVVETPDRVQHMFWRAVDKSHPLYSEEVASRYGSVIPDAYRKMDAILGLVMRYVDDRTTLLVLSDHGFKSFRRAVHLNSWLRDNGFLTYKEGGQGGAGREFFAGVDWQRTKAYAVGLGSIYLNLAGREKLGSVKAGAEADEVKRRIAEGLKGLKDGAAGKPVVRAVHLGEAIFEGEAASDAPDLLVGFEDGYRASWQTALGASPAAQLEDNLKKWSGDHIIDSELVPGILFSNKKIMKPNPSLYDLLPTVLSLYQIKIPGDMRGGSLFDSSGILHRVIARSPQATEAISVGPEEIASSLRSSQ